MLNHMIDHESKTLQPNLKTNSGQIESAFLFMEIAVPPMNPLTAELVGVQISLVQQGEYDGSLLVVPFKSASQISPTVKVGFQSREAELDQLLMILDTEF